MKAKLGIAPIGAGFAALISASSAMAANIGVSMAKFDENFLTVLRNGLPDARDGRRQM